MNIDPFLIWLESTALSQWVVSSPSLLAFPGILSLHALGMGFAVGICLALDLRIDSLPSPQDDPSTMLQALDDLVPKLVAYFVGFLLLARYWRAHHGFFGRLRAVDSRLLTLNLTYLGFVALLPFPTSLIGEYETLVDEILMRLSPQNYELAVSLASVPEYIRGYGHVKERHLKGAKAREAVLLARLRDGAQQATATAKVPVAAD